MLIWRKPKDGMNPVFVAALDGALGPLPDTWYVIQAKRDSAYQAALFAKYQAGGPRAAPPGYSPHEFGLAVDVALDADAVRAGLQPNWDLHDVRWQRLIHTVRDSRLLHSGIGFGDADHVEMVHWGAYKP